MYNESEENTRTNLLRKCVSTYIIICVSDEDSSELLILNFQNRLRTYWGRMTAICSKWHEIRARPSRTIFSCLETRINLPWILTIYYISYKSLISKILRDYKALWTFFCLWYKSNLSFIKIDANWDFNYLIIEAQKKNQRLSWNAERKLFEKLNGVSQYVVFPTRM